MTKLLDGPAEGAYIIKRAPLFLRAVTGVPGSRDVQPDVLDQLDDRPAEHEAVSVYRRVGEPIYAHINRGGKGSGFFSIAEYRHMPQINGETLRDTAAWREWVTTQTDALDAY